MNKEKGKVFVKRPKLKMILIREKTERQVASNLRTFIR